MSQDNKIQVFSFFLTIGDMRIIMKSKLFKQTIYSSKIARIKLVTLSATKGHARSKSEKLLALL